MSESEPDEKTWGSVFRDMLPSLLGVLIGGSITLATTFQTSRVQLELAQRTAHDQARQRRIEASKTFFSACYAAALAAHRAALAHASPTAEPMERVREMALSNLTALLQVSAEFPSLNLVVFTDSILGSDDLRPFVGPYRLGETEQDERDRGMLTVASELDTQCRQVQNDIVTELQKDS